MDKLTQHEALKEILKEGILYSFKSKIFDTDKDNYDVLVEYLQSREAFALYTEIVESPSVEKLVSELKRYELILSEIVAYVSACLGEAIDMNKHSELQKGKRMTVRTLETYYSSKASVAAYINVLDFIKNRFLI